jgi:hypothetical protein
MKWPTPKHFNLEPEAMSDLGRRMVRKLRENGGVMALLLGSLFLQPSVEAEVVLSEFLASNTGLLEDADGDASDWIEVWNPGPGPVQLSGYSLTDDGADRSKWVFPAVELQAGERLVVFASGKNRRVAGKELHTNFLLDANGEYLGLFNAQRNEVTEFKNFPAQFDDISFGLGSPTEEVVVLGPGVPCRWLIPDALTPGWQDKEFDDRSWAEGKNGVGYDIELGEGSYLPLIGEGSDVFAEMRGVNTTCYIRYEFELVEPSNVELLVFGNKYDDGFVAYLNGAEVVRDLAPNVPTFTTEAINARLEAEVFEWAETDISHRRELLQPGRNVLALQGLNRGPGSSDFVQLPRLRMEVSDPNRPPQIGYFTVTTPGNPNVEPLDGIVKDTRFSVDRGYYEVPFELEITTPTPEAQIFFTTNGSDPSPNNGSLYTGPVTISKTSVVRAAAFRDGFSPTNVDTHTYLFVKDIRNQPAMSEDVVNKNADEFDAALRSLPVISLTLGNSVFFGNSGIHTDPDREGREAEVPVSVEYFDFNRPDEFQVDAGVRIHGGNARDHPKKPLRLFFRREYGAGRLKFPLFDDSPVSSFDQLVLRSCGHDSWSLADTFQTRDQDIPPHAGFVRDQFLRKTENDMGRLAPHGKYVQVYINGTYWGFYDLHERPNGAFFQSYLGGAEEDWDVVHHPTFVIETESVVDGEVDAWEELHELLSGDIKTIGSLKEIERFIDFDAFADHMIVRIWSSDYDWCGPVFLPDEEDSVNVFNSKNWYAGRQSRNGEGPFHFFTWDAEMSMGLHLLRNLPGFDSNGNLWFFHEQRVIDFDLTKVNDFRSPAALYDAFRQNEGFRIRFADRVQRLFFHEGALTESVAQARLARLTEAIDQAILAESARWGDEDVIELTRDEHWRPEIAWLMDEFIPKRREVVLNQFRAQGLYPSVDAPELSQLGGEIDAGFELEMSPPEAGTIFFTTDGTDPLTPRSVETRTLIPEGAEAQVFVPTAVNIGSDPGYRWNLLLAPSNFDVWKRGNTAVGYDVNAAYRPLIELDLIEEFASVGTSIYIRVPFVLDEGVVGLPFNELSLQMRYDDGFVAYLNGVEVGRENAEDPITWRSAAVLTNDDNRAIQFEPFEIKEHTGLLRDGFNVLAVQLLNVATVSSDALLEPRLIATWEVTPEKASETAQAYGGPVPINDGTVVKARVLADDGKWSALVEAEFVVGKLPSASNLAVSQLHYRPLPPQGGAELTGGWGSSDFEFVELMNITDGPVDLEGVAFVTGVEFVFPKVILKPGERTVVVANEDAFIARYGATLADSILIAGKFSKGKLSNGGERVLLQAPNGDTVSDFRYDDEGGWPTAPDGVGYSLVLVDPMSAAVPGDSDSWTRSIDIHGSPGAAAILTFPQWQKFYFSGATEPERSQDGADEDPDADGMTNFQEFALGTDPLSTVGDIGLVQTPIDFVLDDDAKIYPVIRFRGREGVDYAAQTSIDLRTWWSSGTDGGPVLRRCVESGDGSFRFEYRAIQAIADGQSVYLRAAVSQIADQPPNNDDP